MRLVLVANNPKADLSRIRPTDALIQFNHCDHFDALQRHPGPRLYVWRKNGDGTVSGWHGHEPARDYNGALHVVLGHHARTEYECERRGWPFRQVTVQPPRYGRGIPSTGFWTAYVLKRMGADIALCGFTFGPAWPGHDWAFEREWCAGIPRV